jgi:kinesin family protein 6/9
MNNVINEATVNIQLDTAALLKKYRKEIKELRQELAMHNTLANRGRINYDPYTSDEQFPLQNLALSFLKGDLEEMEFESVRQAKELFTQCRYLYQKAIAKNRDLATDGNEEAAIERKFTKDQINLRKASMKGMPEGVGDEEVKPSFGIGRALKDAKPVNKRKNIFLT